MCIVFYIILDTTGKSEMGLYNFGPLLVPFFKVRALVLKSYIDLEIKVALVTNLQLVTISFSDFSQKNIFFSRFLLFDIF